MDALVQVEDVRFAYNAHHVLAGISFALRRNEFVGLVGPNGAGKTTLLHTLLGFLEPREGRILLCGDPVHQLTRRSIAQRAALVPQEAGVAFPFSVRDVVAMGRNPYLGRFRPEGEADVAAVERALAETETEALADRLADTLSGGERQRVLVARALAQETPVILLDEPTANLDLAHQLEVLDLVRGVAAQGRGALAAIHDLSLASRYCDRIMVLHDGVIAADGPPDEVVTEANLARYFDVHASIQPASDGRGMTVLPLHPLRTKNSASAD